MLRGLRKGQGKATQTGKGRLSLLGVVLGMQRMEARVPTLISYPLATSGHRV